jgi:hypothetical protein
LFGNEWIGRIVRAGGPPGPPPKRGFPPWGFAGVFFFFFITLGLKLSDTNVYEH